MAKQSVEDSFTFVGGLHTEGGFFLTPKNSWKEGTNIVPKQDGSIERRKGLNFEQNYALSVDLNLYIDDMDLYAFSTNMWESVAGDGNLDFFVVQYGPKVRFYKAGAQVVSESDLGAVFDLNNYRCFGNTSNAGFSRITTTSCYGKLLITSKDIDPVLIDYNKDTNTFKAQVIKLRIRDFEGIRSPAAMSVEKTEAEWEALSFWPDAKYNLYNQGWKNPQLLAYTTANSGKYPSNTKQWIYGKDTNDDFDVSVLAKQDFGTSTAPKGRFILEAFYQDRSTAAAEIEDSGIDLDASIVPPAPNVNDDLPYGSLGGGGWTEVGGE